MVSGLHGERAATLAAAAKEDTAAIFCFGSRDKAVRFCALTLFWLVRSLHT